MTEERSALFQAIVERFRACRTRAEVIAELKTQEDLFRDVRGSAPLLESLRKARATLGRADAAKAPSA